MSTTDMPISLHDVVELETHANWTAVDIGDPDDWTLQLTDAHHAELDAGLTQARSTTDDVLAVTADDFTLPTLGPLLATMAEELRTDPMPPARSMIMAIKRVSLLPPNFTMN